MKQAWTSSEGESSSFSSSSSTSAAATAAAAPQPPIISTNYAFTPPTGTVGAPEPLPPPSILHPPAGQSSLTDHWNAPATTEDFAGEGDDDEEFDDTQFVFENGRRYHADAPGRALYPLPNDEPEQERDDMKHKLAEWVMHEKLFYSPVEDALEKGGMVFDLGTGIGEWCMEMAKLYGKSQLFGCDISPIQPDYVWDNVFFSIGDMEEDWADYPENSFDLIHMRYAAFAVKDPVALLQRAMKHLRPGGYIEFQEMVYWPHTDDGTLTDSTPYAFRDFCYYMQLGLASLGFDLHTINRIPADLRNCGFDDITEVQHKLPIGRWARDRKQQEKGIWFLRMIILEGLGAVCKRPFTRGLGWDDVQIEMFLVDVRRSLNDSAVHAYFPFTVIYGRKPLEGGSNAAGPPTSSSGR